MALVGQTLKTEVSQYTCPRILTDGIWITTIINKLQTSEKLGILTILPQTYLHFWLSFVELVAEQIKKKCVNYDPVL